MTIYSLDTLLSQFWTSLLFPVWFLLLLLTCIQFSQEIHKVVWYSHLSKIFHSLLWSTQSKALANKAEVDVFLEFPCFFNDRMDVGNLISSSSAFSKYSLNIWKFSVHVLLKSGFENFQYYFASVWNVCNCVVIWTFFGIAFLWDWNENTFSSPVATAEFSKFAGILSEALSQHHLLGFEIAFLEFHHFH